MADLRRVLPSGTLLTLLAITIHFTVLSMATTVAVSKDQVPCTMCYACENPCLPLPSPPPPSPPPPCPPPPAVKPPPPPSLPECPPPPAPPTCGGCNKLPPESGNIYASPPPAGGGGGVLYPLAPPSGGYFPQNPMTPYFPYYNYPPPSSAYYDSGSGRHVELNWVAFAVVAIFLVLIPQR